MSSIDVAYYRRRLAEERDRAAAATDPRIAQLHNELAQAYQRLLDEHGGEYEIP